MVGTMPMERLANKPEFTQEDTPDRIGRLHPK